MIPFWRIWRISHYEQTAAGSLRWWMSAFAYVNAALVGVLVADADWEGAVMPAFACAAYAWIARGARRRYGSGETKETAA